ncbi:glycosidase [Candidatus Nomurabacteria bacterium CG10_big_fil_rev_8_21_14_0_10_35_16]|uniref:Glycosidase n=1 Tax=Candidatus Nomurabacteria bacterium CG10_big_fil_rev_8_21_14_0_10_35_16 TaxID=1974731 RepID=A0A2H0TC68_9BACT|nr:MAG: glycosidase [Candidatus Nomurabacteria bacterium CG10_big_fil_rev_8_21_14_0_10_35_16]
MDALKKKKTTKKKVGKTKKIVKVKKTSIRKIARTVKKKTSVSLKLKKAPSNPIIEPRLYPWESKATFNPAAFLANGKVHLIYRAIGDNDSSVLGYASSHDGYSIVERYPYPIYRRAGNFSRPDLSVAPIDYVSGGGWSGGCEDPRLTLLGDTVYMLYTAFDGWGSLRIALTSIKLYDFERGMWNWKNPVLISPPNEIHKNWVLFPEKINGKFAILHSFYPNILIDYFDSLDELDGKKFIKSDNTRPVDVTRTWDSWFRGVGPSPIKTKLGWLILYHAMDHKNPDRYKMGALILDFNNPTKVLYRSSFPILEPEEYYENNGYKWGVVYSCGAVVKEDVLFVYYGGADKVVGVAYIKLNDLLNDLQKNGAVKLKKQSTKI